MTTKKTTKKNPPKKAVRFTKKLWDQALSECLPSRHDERTLAKKLGRTVEEVASRAIELGVREMVDPGMLTSLEQMPEVIQEISNHYGHDHTVRMIFARFERELFQASNTLAGLQDAIKVSERQGEIIRSDISKN